MTEKIDEFDCYYYVFSLSCVHYFASIINTEVLGVLLCCFINIERYRTRQTVLLQLLVRCWWDTLLCVRMDLRLKNDSWFRAKHEPNLIWAVKKKTLNSLKSCCTRTLEWELLTILTLVIGCEVILNDKRNK